VETRGLGLSVSSVRIPKRTSLVIDDYITQPEIIKPGNTFDLEIDIDCEGAKAYEVKAVLSFDFGTSISVLSPTMVSLGDLESEQHASIGYKLLVDGEVKAGQYPARLTVSYLDVDGIPSTFVETLTFRINGIVEFMLINENPLNMPRGGIIDFEADLLLIGTESVKFISLRVVEDSIFKRTGESEEYIGAIDPDSPIPFDLEVLVSDDVGLGMHNLTLSIEYIDDLYQEHETTLDIPVNVVEEVEDRVRGSAGGFWAWLRRLLGLGP
jgi:hypothetical protein